MASPPVSTWKVVVSSATAASATSNAPWGVTAALSGITTSMSVAPISRPSASNTSSRQAPSPRARTSTDTESSSMSSLSISSTSASVDSISQSDTSSRHRRLAAVTRNSAPCA